MELLNATPLCAAYTQGLAVDGRESLVVIAKGTFDLPLDGREARLLDAQKPLLMADEFSGAAGLSAPLQEMDFAPYKPFCDVLLQGHARTPNDQPASRVTVGIRVGRVSKAFSVTGERHWQSGDFLGISPSEPSLFTQQPISYAQAFGGCHSSPEHADLCDSYSSNPCGVGWFPKQASNADIVGTAMPNTEALNQPIDDPHGHYQPMAFGPIARHWPPRLEFAGSYDEQWLAEQFPFLPTDFDERYFQAAPLDQQTEHLQGGEEVLLLNLTCVERASFRLPSLQVPVTLFFATGGHQTLTSKLDTLFINTDAGTVELTWRTRWPLKRNLFEISQVLVGEQSRAWWRARTLGKTYYPSLAHLHRANTQAEQS